MEAHALVARLAADVPFPFLCMLVSGGHNMLLVAHAVGDYTLMGSTLDDSVGRWAANMHTSYFTAPLSATTELKHAHCFVMSTPKVCSAAYRMPCDHYLPGFAAASYSPFSTLHTTQIHTTFLVTRQSLASALLHHITVSESHHMFRLKHINCCHEVHHLLASITCSIHLAGIHHMQYTPCCNVCR